MAQRCNIRRIFWRNRVSDSIRIRNIQKSYSIPWLDPRTNSFSEFSLDETIDLGVPKSFVSQMRDVSQLPVFALKKALWPSRRIGRQLLLKLDGADKVHACKRSKVFKRRLCSIATSNEQIQPIKLSANIR
jgi:hypothetical protein